jgi:hypothetical protein
MAKDETTSLEPERRSPVAVTVALLTAFVLLAIVGVVTVVMPEVSDAGDDEEAETEAAAASDPPHGAAAPPAGSAAPAAPAPAGP